MSREDETILIDDLFAMDGTEFLGGAQFDSLSPLAAAVADDQRQDPRGSLAASASAAVSRGTAQQIDRQGPTLYFDIETVPDYERAERFGLSPLPTVPEAVAESECPSVDDVLKKTVDEIKDVLRKSPWPLSWLDALAQAEREAPKSRKGVVAEIESARRWQDIAIAHVATDTEARRKLLSTTPEFCRIVAIGWASGEHVEAAVVSHSAPSAKPGQKTVDEIELLELFWRLASDAGRLVGFNCLAFDLPTIFIRSAILGVQPTRYIDLRPWSADVLDLYLCRFGARGNSSKDRPGKLKDLARVYGLPVPAGDCDGSQVERLWREEPAKLGQYVTSDIEVTRALHEFYRGLFAL